MILQTIEVKETLEVRKILASQVKHCKVWNTRIVVLTAVALYQALYISTL